MKVRRRTMKSAHAVNWDGYPLHSGLLSFYGQLETNPYPLQFCFKLSSVASSLSQLGTPALYVGVIVTVNSKIKLQVLKTSFSGVNKTLFYICTKSHVQTRVICSQSNKFHHHHQFLTPPTWRRWVRIKVLHCFRSIVHTVSSSSISVRPSDVMSSFILSIQCILFMI